MFNIRNTGKQMTKDTLHIQDKNGTALTLKIRWKKLQRGIRNTLKTVFYEGKIKTFLGKENLRNQLK